MTIKENVKYLLENVDAAVAASTLSHSVNVLAVTKYVGVEEAREVIESGISHIAENRTELFLEKYKALNNPEDKKLTWHLIGSLQRRKVREVINLVDYFHALDSVKLAGEINKRAEHVIKCFLEVNVSGEESKHGFRPSELSEVVSQMAQFENIQIVGLMTMAPFKADEEELNNIFSQTKQLQVEIADRNLAHAPCTELSMGMSRDYKIAIQNGASFIRVGTQIFK